MPTLDHVVFRVADLERSVAFYERVLPARAIARKDGKDRWRSRLAWLAPEGQSGFAVVLIQLTLLYFNMVTLIFTLTGGGPLASTETLAVRVLKVSFEDWNIGRGAALGLVITVVNFAFSAFYVRVLKPSDPGGAS